MTTFEQTFEELPLAGVHDLAAARHAEGWRYVQILAVNTEEGIDLVYSYMKDGHLANFNVSGVKQTDVVPSITDLYLEAFVCENEIHDLFDVAISDIAIDFGGMFYQLAEKAPMTVVSPEQLAAREKAKKIAAAKAAKEAKAAAPTEAPTGPTEEEIQAKIAGLDPEISAISLMLGSGSESSFFASARVLSQSITPPLACSLPMKMFSAMDRNGLNASS